MWTFLPQTLTEINIAKGTNTQIIYTVHNQSSRPKKLIMKPIAGVSQDSPCELPANGNCSLVLRINGSALKGDVLSGPVLCHQGDNLQCYQPNLANILQIHLTDQPPIQQFTITPTAGTNGSISPATAQVVNTGSTLTFTAIPDAGFGINEWLLDGNVVQTGGTTYQLNNIQTFHAVEVTFNQTTLSPLTQNLTLSINGPGADPLLTGNTRIIRIANTGSLSATNVQVSAFGLPPGTSITNNTCIGTLNAGNTCDITITPGGVASLNNFNIACTTSPGTEPLPTSVTVQADNTPPTNVNVLVLGYGCIYQGGFLFAIDDSTPATGGIGGKVAALTDEEENPGDFNILWATVNNNTAADSIIDGAANTNALTNPVGQYPAAQACLNKNAQGFNDWFLPAICELGRYVNPPGGNDAGCGTTNPNLYTTLRTNNLGSFTGIQYWSSTENSGNPNFTAWSQSFSAGNQVSSGSKINPLRVRCVRAFNP